MILVTGAAGKTGRAIIRALHAKEAHTRAFVRRTEQIAPLQQDGAIDVIVGDLRRPEDLAHACRQVHTLYHICPNMQPDEVSIAEQLFAIARSAGVQRIVYHSVLHPQTQAMPHHWQKNQVEELLFTTGLDYTILQPAAYMQNVLAGWQRIVNEGIYQVPYRLSTRLGMVDLNDVAEAAALVLTTRNHNSATYELASDEWLTQTEVAAILGTVMERSVRAVQQLRPVWQQAVRNAGLSAYAISTLNQMFDYYEAHGFCGNGQILHWLLGRKPTLFADFVKAQLPMEEIFS